MFGFALIFCAFAMLALGHPIRTEKDGIFSIRRKFVPIMEGHSFPDPSVIRTPDGWHAFSTHQRVDDRLIHVQVGHTADFQSWTLRRGVDALPKLPKWVDGPNKRVWAPDVNQLDDGTFIMYYTAAMKSHPRLHCLGYAKSQTVEGPYVDPNPEPWVCPTARGGAIDPAGYYDAQDGGRRWVVYKIDGNSLGNGGACGNTIAPIVPTPIMLQEVASDGHTKIGEPIEILRNIPSDGPYIEAPSLSYLDGKFVLFFSSHCFTSRKYDVQYATAEKITGPYTRREPLLVTGMEGLVAPGGLDLAVNGNHAIWHGDYGEGRAAYTGILSLSGNTVTVKMAGDF